MTEYVVEFTPRAEQEFNEAVDWYEAQGADAALKWLNAFEFALNKLEKSPENCPKLRERLQLPVVLHEHRFGAGKRLTHRFVFAIRPEKVMVYAFRHLSQRDLTEKDF